MSAVAEKMPQAYQYKPLKDLKTVDEAVDHPEVIRRFQNALGERLDAVQFLATIRNLARDDEAFKRVDVWELMRCALDLAELGLRPNTPFGHAWIIPRVMKRGKPDEKITLSVQIGWQGMLELAYRAGVLESIHADVVYEGDEFSHEYGSNAHLRHVPKGARRDRRPLQAYCHAKLKGGGETFVVWDYADVLDIRDTSDAYKYALSQKGSQNSRAWDTCVWVKYPYQMAQKTVCKQLLKKIPRSAEFLIRATYIDDISEAGKVTYAGAAGDLSAGAREISYQPTTTLADIGLKTATIVQTADPVRTSTGAPAAAQSSQVAAPQTQNAPVTLPGEEAGTAPLRLFSPYGDNVAEVDTLREWVMEFCRDAIEVPPEDAQAYRELNADNLATAYMDPALTAQLSKSGFGPLLQAQEGGDDLDLVASLLIRPPAAGDRPNDSGIIDLFTQSLAAVNDERTFRAWEKANKPTVREFHGKVKLPILREISRRAAALGIPPETE